MTGFFDSSVTSATFVINLPPAATPIFSPPAGTYTSVQTVTMSSATSGASIAYTTDSSTPAENGGSVTTGTLLSNGGSIPVPATTTIKAIAFASGYTDSTVATAAYTISLPAPVPTVPRMQGSSANRTTTNAH